MQQESTAPDDLLARLRAGDADAFAAIVDAWSPGMLRLARSHVSTDASAEDVVQDAWLGVLRGLDRFEGRSSLRTWVFSIVANLAKTRGVREHRTIPMSTLAGDDDPGWAELPADRFRPAGDRWPGHWTPAAMPTPWPAGPEGAALAHEADQLVRAALDALPPRQRLVVSLRDVHGWTADEVCDSLGISQGNQRVLLHRGRTTVRAQLEDYYRGRVTA